jgi:ribonuclease P/MRP protein subunit POP5
MNMPKTLPPALRPNKRYVIFEIISEHPVEYSDFSSAVWASLLDFAGELGASDARIWLIANLYDDKRQRGIIKCSNISVETVRAALSLVQIISEHKCIVRVIGVTGTLKSAQDKYLVD